MWAILAATPSMTLAGGELVRGLEAFGAACFDFKRAGFDLSFRFEQISTTHSNTYSIIVLTL